MPQENLARKDDAEIAQNPEKVAELRKKYVELVKKHEFSSKADNEENEKWLQENLFKADPNLLAQMVEYHPRAVAFDKDLLRQWKEKLDGMVKKGLLAEKSVAEYEEWFKEEKAGEKIAYLKKSDLDDINRTKTASEFKAVYEFFRAEAAGKSAAAFEKKFASSDLQERQKIVTELKKKKSLLTKEKLPSHIKEKLKAEILGADLSVAEKIITDAQKEHTEIKGTFLKLPPLIQAEFKEQFKAQDFPGRRAVLADVQEKMQSYTHSYGAKIANMQKPNAHGLTLFSSTPASVAGGSAHTYMKWFTEKLTLSGMEASLASSDLDSTERRETVRHMEQLLEKLPAEKRPALILKFNTADLDARKDLVKQHANSAQDKGATQDAQGVVGRLLGRLFANKDTEFNKKRRAEFAAREITDRVHRARQAQHTTINKLGEEAKEAGLHETVSDSADLMERVRDERFRGANGGLDLRISQLEHAPDALHGLEAGLKKGIDKHDAKFVGVGRLIDEHGNTVSDEEAYTKGTLERKRAKLQEEAAQKIQTQAALEGTSLQLDATKDAIAKNWEELSKETIRETAA